MQGGTVALLVRSLISLCLVVNVVTKSETHKEVCYTFGDNSYLCTHYPCLRKASCHRYDYDDTIPVIERINDLRIAATYGNGHKSGKNVFDKRSEEHLGGDPKRPSDLKIVVKSDELTGMAECYAYSCPGIAKELESKKYGKLKMIVFQNPSEVDSIIEQELDQADLGKNYETFPIAPPAGMNNLKTFLYNGLTHVGCYQTNKLYCLFYKGYESGPLFSTEERGLCGNYICDGEVDDSKDPWKIFIFDQAEQATIPKTTTKTTTQPITKKHTELQLIEDYATDVHEATTQAGRRAFCDRVRIVNGFLMAPLALCLR